MPRRCALSILSVLSLTAFSSEAVAAGQTFIKGASAGFRYEGDATRFVVLSEKSKKPIVELKNSEIRQKATKCPSGEDAFETESTDTRKPLSLVGSYLSIETQSYSDTKGAAHPSAVTSWEMKDLNAPDKSVSIDRIFPEKDVFSALMNDGLVKRALARSKPTTLSALIKKLEDWNVSDDEKACDYRFDNDMLAHAAFFDVKDDKVYVRIGLSHGCELARGNLTQIGIALPIPAGLKQSFEKAKKSEQGFLMAQSKKWPSYSMAETSYDCE